MSEEVSDDRMVEGLLSEACELLEREAQVPRGKGFPSHNGILCILMLCMDDATLDRYVPMGRHLLHVLQPVLQGCAERRAQLLECARAFLLDEATSRDFWKRIDSECGSARAVSEIFSLQQRIQNAEDYKKQDRGKKKAAISDFEAEMTQQGAISCHAPLFQVVYPKKKSSLSDATKKKKSAWFDADTWRSHIVIPRWEQALCVQHARLMGSCPSVKDWNDLQENHHQHQSRAACGTDMVSIVEVRFLFY